MIPIPPGRVENVESAGTRELRGSAFEMRVVSWYHVSPWYEQCDSLRTEVVSLAASDSVLKGSADPLSEIDGCSSKVLDQYNCYGSKIPIAKEHESAVHEITPRMEIASSR